MTLTHEQMLELWKLHSGLEPALAEASVSRFDCLDVDRLLSLKMRAWYVDLMRRGDTAYVEPVEIVDRLKFKRTRDKHALVARLPPDVVCVISTKLDGFRPPVSAPALDADSVESKMATRRGAHACLTRRAAPPKPDAWVAEDNLIVDYFDIEARVPWSVMAITDPGDELYRLTEAALGLIPRAVTGAE